MTSQLRTAAGALVGAACALALGLAVPALGDVNVSGSAFVDYWHVTSLRAQNAALTGITPEVALKLEADVHESLAFSARVCFGCHGLEVDRAHLDFTPSPHF